ncbi:MAG: phosphoribosylglycinamide formyltransferase [Moraxellaceae bacterium]|nr:phosphoribosylglycinamide formyltransferase [Moraxellaceae bacterium]MDP1775292.1 phosphoribosylglycinamide formyltransferase [Moraxellaceae bacterium]MDZ4297690.1 phosphoribosylglycinamide formyltransferase [Moraxellaceae bacterium]MDZ4385963.1 phosphoribosylglycinamide formyltransferase [Moraxellaceae bacterium]
MSFRIVVLASGNGSNLQAILDACDPHMQVVGVLSNKPTAFCLTRAQHQGIPTAVIEHSHYPEREPFDAAMCEVIDAWQPDLVVLAGFMRILTPAFVNHYASRLINIHPSLLPKYKGLHTHQRALEAGDSEHGCSVHLVNAELDGGPVLAQMVVPVLKQDSAETLAQRVHKAEHLIYPAVISWFAHQRLQLNHGQIVLDGEPLLNPKRQYLA